MSDAPAAASAAPATDAPAGAPAAPTPPAAPAPKTEAPKASAKPAEGKPWVNPYVARKAAQTAPQKPAAAPVAPAAPAVDPAARLAEIEAAHKASGEKLTRYEATLKARVAQDLAALPERVRKTIEARAGGDPVRTLEMITDAHEMGLGTAPLAGTATTAPAPPSPSTAVDPDAAILAQYTELARKAPTYALAFRLQHAAAIARAESRRAS